MVTFIETGTDELKLSRTLLEHYSPGEKVDLRVNLSRNLSQQELESYGNYIYDHGLDVDFVEMSGGKELRVVFRRPGRTEFEGVGFVWTPATILIGGILALGTIAIISWGTVKIIDAISNNLVQILLVGAGTFLVYKYLQRKPAYR